MPYRGYLVPVTPTHEDEETEHRRRTEEVNRMAERMQDIYGDGGGWG